jgi:hypothetical protein
MKRLLNGYRQFDPTRGTVYILDLLLLDEHGIEHIKRAELMRPLGLVEIVPMPFVTEMTKITFILPILTDETQVALRFLHHANRTFFEKESSEKFELILAHLVTNKHDQNQSNKWFDTFRHQMEMIRRDRPKIVVSFQTVLLPLLAIHVPALRTAIRLSFSAIRT